MTDKELNRDSAAQAMFGHPYTTLSSWGQQHVDEVLAKMGKVDAPHNATLKTGADPDSLRLANENLARANEQLRLENGDLWEENGELLAEIAELRAKWNPSDS